MSRYAIDPGGVERVLRSVHAGAEKFGTILRPLEGWVESAASGTAMSPPICSALQSFFSDQSIHLDNINRRCSASLNGALQATQAYVDGDLEMVGAYQRDAVSAALPPVPERPMNRGMVAY